MFDEVDNLRREKADLVAERDLLTDKLHHAQLNSATIKENSGRSKFYTGLSWDVFMKLSFFLPTFKYLCKMHTFCYRAVASHISEATSKSSF